MNKNVLIAASPGSASRTLLKSIETSLKKKSIHLKSATGIGHLIVNVNLKQKIYFYLNNKLFINKKFLLYQHFFPSYYNLSLLKKYIGQTDFIITYRNIFEQIKYLHKINDNAGITPLSFVSVDNQLSREKEKEKDLIKKNTEVEFALILTLNFYKLWFELIKNKSLEKYLLVNYEDIIKNDEKLKNDLSSFLNERITLNFKDNLLPKKDFKITDFQFEIVDNFIKSNPELDFSCILN